VNQLNNPNDKLPNVLIISVNCLHSQNNNGKTLLKQFENYPKEKVAQFYTHNEFPNIVKFDNYFRITDIDVFKKRFFKKSVSGKIIAFENLLNIKARTNRFNLLISKFRNSHFLRFLRDYLWFGLDWKSEELDNWIEDFKPEVIYFVGLNNPNLFRLNEFYSNKYSIPTIIYVTDDYYLPRFSISFFYWYRLSILNRHLKLLLNKENTQLITINEIMSKEYLNRFNKKNTILVNNVNLKILDKFEYVNSKSVRISYIGNLSHNRWKSIIKLGEVISKHDFGYSLNIQIYCSEYVNNRIINRINNISCLKFYGAINHEQVINVINNSDILLHVESFKFKDINLAKLSFSTKITEYIASGKPILAFGPNQVASIKILERYNAAICIVSLKKQLILSEIQKIFDLNKLEEVRTNALRYLNLLYSKNKINSNFNEYIKEMVASKK